MYKRQENRHLEDQILEVRVPMQEVVELKNGVQKASQKKMFPGYVMIHMIMNDDTWYVVRNTRGVTGFVGPGSKPVQMCIRDRCRTNQFDDGKKQKLRFFTVDTILLHRL